MLGFIHKWVLGLVPPALRTLFAFNSRASTYATRSSTVRHSRQLVDPFATQDFYNRSALLARSVDGLIGVYNRLPAHVLHNSVSNFQKDLNDGAKSAVAFGVDLEDLCKLCFI